MPKPRFVNNSILTTSSLWYWDKTNPRFKLGINKRTVDTQMCSSRRTYLERVRFELQWDLDGLLSCTWSSIWQRRQGIPNCCSHLDTAYCCLWKEGLSVLRDQEPHRPNKKKYFSGKLLSVRHSARIIRTYPSYTDSCICMQIPHDEPWGGGGASM